jgi:hypothetical protein
LPLPGISFARVPEYALASCSLNTLPDKIAPKRETTRADIALQAEPPDLQ